MKQCRAETERNMRSVNVVSLLFLSRSNVQV